jgi:hypothetical protein
MVTVITALMVVKYIIQTTVLASSYPGSLGSTKACWVQLPNIITNHAKKKDHKD